MSQFHKLTITEIHKETEDSVTLSFNVPQELQEIFKFKAGQYITLKSKESAGKNWINWSLRERKKANFLAHRLISKTHLH